VDARAAALARYLRQCAASFSMSADVTNQDRTAQAGMALLDAAAIADAMAPEDGRIKALSEAGRFESMPDGQALFLETPGIRAAIHRPLAAERRTGVQIIAELVATATGFDQRPPGTPRR
jgi:hypothetical protein